MSSSDPTEGKQAPHRFKPGQSGNPAGRPRGSRHAALQALDLIGQEGAGAVLEKIVEQAKAGDARSAEILLRRVWPERKGRSVMLDLPRLERPADVVRATAAVAEAVAAGEVTPDEGAAVVGVIEAHRRAIETHELEARLAALEAAQRN
ncbi:DUF5681 domain-containing protein [Muricoccus radiodurans]|uniref:DUF5681 domain-containing protein n=1 Tax=Muricoccus radiodurans TaxID=2231721 RepID=UPI003CF2E8EB